jgi:hypothetical protein
VNNAELTANNTPLRRVGQHDASYLSGQTLYVNGGAR